jgi:hypothetical protein
MCYYTKGTFNGTSTTFSGPVTSDNGFIGALTGNVTGNIAGTGNNFTPRNNFSQVNATGEPQQRLGSRYFGYHNFHLCSQEPQSLFLRGSYAVVLNLVQHTGHGV